MRHIQGLATALVLGVAPAFAVAQTELPSGAAGGRSTTNNQAQQDRQGTQSQRGDDATAQGRDTRQSGRAGEEATGQAGRLGGAQGGAQGAGQFDDQLFLAAARESGQAEILTSQLAVERASNDQVKQFARQMIEDHEQLNQQLMQGGQGGAGGRGGAGATGSGRTGTEGASGGAAGARPGSGDQAARSAADAAITGGEQSGRLATGSGAQAGRTGTEGAAGAAATELRQAARPAFMQGGSSLSPGKQAEYAILSSKQGEEFDKAYMKSQVASHICAVALFEAESQMGQEYKEVASQALPKIQQHLQMAKQICEQVDPSSASSGGQHGAQGSQRSGQSGQSGQGGQSGQSGQSGSESTRRPQ